jgi:hypothetical protein
MHLNFGRRVANRKWLDCKISSFFIGLAGASMNNTVGIVEQTKEQD